MRRERMNKRGIGGVLLRLLLVGAVLLCGLMLFVRTCKLTEIEVHTGERYTEQELIDLLVTDKLDQYAVLCYLRHKLFAQEELPFLEKVEVTLTSRNSLEITVYEKRITGCVEVMGKYLYFDKDGKVVESSAVRLADVPLVTGLKFKEIVKNEYLEVQSSVLFDRILELSKLIEKYELSITEIAFAYDNAVTLHQENGTEILLGTRETYDEPLAALPAILESLAGRIVVLDISKYSKDSRIITANEKE